MSRNRGLIQNDKYFTQVGQLGRRVRSSYGDTSITSITTINLVLYQEQDQTLIAAPAMDTSIRHFACIPSSSVPRQGDEIRNVVDQFGNALLEGGRIDEIIAYNDPFHGTRFLRVRLDLDLST